MFDSGQLGRLCGALLEASQRVGYLEVELFTFWAP